MQAVKTIGLDIAKSIFQMHGVDADGQVVIRRKLKRQARGAGTEAWRCARNSPAAEIERLRDTEKDRTPAAFNPAGVVCMEHSCPPPPPRWDGDTGMPAATNIICANPAAAGHRHGPQATGNHPAH